MLSCLADKQQIPILLIFGLNWKELELTNGTYHIQGEQINHHTTPEDTTIWKETLLKCSLYDSLSSMCL